MSEGARILVIDDEQNIRKFLKSSLTSNGYFFMEADDGAGGISASLNLHPDVIILDLGLPDIDGFEVLRRIRKRSKTPVIILSVRDSVDDKVRALEEGADDYLSKPFDSKELTARVKAVLRRLLPVEQKEVLEAGKLYIDFTKRIISVNGKEIEITPTEYEVLKLLVVNLGNVVTRRQLLSQVWGKSEKTEGALHLLNVTVRNLRAKLSREGDESISIITEPCIGYRFTLK